MSIGSKVDVFGLSRELLELCTFICGYAVVRSKSFLQGDDERHEDLAF